MRFRHSTKTIHGIAVTLLAFATVARGEIVHCGPNENHKEYELLGSRLDFVLRHPFRVFKGSVEKLSGILIVNPSNLGEGMRVKVVVPPEGIESPYGQIRALVAPARGEGKESQGAVFESSLTDIPSLNPEAPVQKLTLRGGLTIGGRLRPLDIPMECSLKVEYWECKVAVDISLSLMGLKGPSLFSIESNDKVAISGEVTFGPKREL